MEDQQLAEGDLTVEDRDDQAQADTAVDGAAEVDSTEKSEATEPESDEPGDADASDTTSEVPRRHDAKTDSTEAATRAKKRTGRWAAALVALAVALFVGSAAFAGRDCAAIPGPASHRRRQAAGGARGGQHDHHIVDLQPDEHGHPCRSRGQLPHRRFRRSVPQVRRSHRRRPRSKPRSPTPPKSPGSRSSHWTVRMPSPSCTPTPPSTSPLTKDIPSLKYLSYRLNMKLEDGRWKVTRMTTVTSLDLTPHL